MTKDEFVIQMLPMVMANDIRLQVHTLVEVDKIWQHVDKECSRCRALELLKLSGEL